MLVAARRPFKIFNSLKAIAESNFTRLVVDHLRVVQDEIQVVKLDQLRFKNLLSSLVLVDFGDVNVYQTFEKF